MIRRTVFCALLCAAPVWAMTAAAVERTAVIIGSRVAVHTVPDGDAAVAGYVNEGMEVVVLGRSDTTETRGEYRDYWYHVSYRSGTGWVYGQFLTLSSGKSPLPRIFTVRELEEWCVLETDNLSRVKDEGLFPELAVLAGRFLDDLEACGDDSILAVHADLINGYRGLALYYQALGYAGAGMTKEAVSARDMLASSYGGATLPDGGSARDLVEEIDRVLGEVSP
ncbi:MAG: SH3 domain-containing protein [Deltaproteobacteria bacterium]|nr:SH3 domain-containing protein [Candidatus Zymogenaceae bacterium]